MDASRLIVMNLKCQETLDVARVIDPKCDFDHRRSELRKGVAKDRRFY
jgi:hypothetical protein